MVKILGDTLKPSIDVGLYIMTCQTEGKDYESIMGFGNLDWCLHGAMQIRWLTETIMQNRIIRVREQYSFWDGKSRMGKDYKPAPGNKILTRSLDGKVILKLKNRNKPVCKKCKSNVLTLDNLCPSCMEITKVLKKSKSKKDAQTYKQFVKEWLSDA